MKVRFVFFATRIDLFAQEIAHIRALLFTHDTESVIMTDSSQLISLIPHLQRESSVVLLFASSNEELEELILMKEHFGSIPTILVLPDDNTETLQKGMLLHPLYFMARHAELRQFTLAVDELCHCCEGQTKQTRRYSPSNTHSRTVS